MQRLMADGKISKGTCVLLRYTLCDADGTLLYKTGIDADVYFHGETRVAPGLYRALAGRRMGEHFEVTLTPADGFGPARESLGAQPLPRGTFPDGEVLKVGMSFEAELPDGSPTTMFITKITPQTVYIDDVHPYAGKVLVYAVDVVKVI